MGLFQLFVSFFSELKLFSSLQHLCDICYSDVCFTTSEIIGVWCVL